MGSEENDDNPITGCDGSNTRWDGFGSKMNVTCHHFAMRLLHLLVMKLGRREC